MTRPSFVLHKQENITFFLYDDNNPSTRSKSIPTRARDMPSWTHDDAENKEIVVRAPDSVLFLEKNGSI